MKRFIATIAATLGLAGAAQAETIVSVTQTSYDYQNHPVCTAVRMNPATFTALPSDPCALATTSATDGPDRINKSQYDAAGELTDVIRAYGVTTANGFPATLQQTYAHYTYTNNGLKQTETDANGNKTTYVYDGFDRLYQLQYPSTTIGSGVSNANDYEQYGYDANGNKTYWRRRDGTIFNDCFDALNRIIVHYIHAQSGCTATGGAADVYTGYDGLGHILWRRFASTSGQGVSYAYDSLGRISSTTDMNGRMISYAYNEASQRTRLVHPDLNYQTYDLNAAGGVNWTGMGSGVVAYSYDNLGRITGVNRMTNWASGAGGTTSYGYDSLGRLTSMTSDLTGTANDVGWTFAYNPAGQITSTTATSTAYDYKEKVSSSDSPTYDGLNRDSRLVPATQDVCPSGGYDTRQNLICDGLTNRNFSYDVENRLVSGGGNGSGGAFSLAYDPEGRLSSYTAGGTTTTFLYDGVNLIAEYNGNATTPLRRYIHGTGTDNPMIWLEGSDTTAVRFFYTDYHGSVIGYADGAGNLAQLYKYGPYGEPRDVNNADNWSGSRFRYTGQTMLYEARLYYYKARVYDPKWGRFLQTDPIGSKDDLDLYAYTGDDPVNKADPTGLDGIYVHYKDERINFYKGGPAIPFAGGHGAAVSIDSKGVTKYSEFGRYPDPKGSGKEVDQVRNIAVPNVTMVNGVPTEKSLTKLFTAIAAIGAKAGSSDIDVQYKYGADAGKMESYAQGVRDNKPGWEPTGVFGTNCRAFGKGELNAGGGNGPTVNTNIKTNGADGAAKDVINGAQ